MSKREELSLEEVQTRIFEILCEFVDFCEEHSLTYRLCGGTMLGAIRHNGFIPWDDDIDVSMPRADYDSFLELTRTIPISSRLRVHSYEDGNLMYPFAKVIDTHTKIEIDQITEDGADGLWIDILPVDGLPENPSMLNKHFKKITLYQKLLMLSLSKKVSSKTVFKKVIKELAAKFIRLIPKSVFIKRLDKLAKKYPYETSNSVGVVSWGLYGTSEIVKKIDYEFCLKKEFREREFCAFRNYENYLSNLYGNYMELPPIQDRQVHGVKAWIK